MSTAEATAAPQALPGEIIGGRYQLGSILGQGGMGTVWRAVHVELGVDVAVKLIPPDLLDSPVALARFKREARAAAAIKSPHVVTVHDYGTDGGRPYLVMELLPGEDLQSYLDREVRLDLEPAAKIFDGICRALRLAHDAGIVHRDLKPGNIFLARVGDEEVVKVLDFGIAKDLHAAADTVKTASDALVGSPRYMSPEQVRGSALDHRSDLWSAAVVLYEMVVGHHPFSGDTVGDVLLKIAMDDIAKPSSLVRSLSPAVDAFFAVALERTVERRFADAPSLAAAFRDAIRAAPGFATTLDAPLGRDDVTADLPTSRGGPSPESPGFVPVAPTAQNPPSISRGGAAEAPSSGAFAAATSRGGVVGPDPDATAPALTRRIAGPPGSSRRWIVAGVVGLGVVGSVAALVWAPPGREPSAATPSAADVATPTQAVAASSASPPVAEPVRPAEAPTPASAASVPSAPKIASAAPTASPPPGRLPAARPGAKPETTGKPGPPPHSNLDQTFGIEDDRP